MTYLIYVTYPNKLNEWSDMTTSTFTVIAVLNHSKNFAVYCLTSSDMREALREYACSLFSRLGGKKGLDVDCGDCGSDKNPRDDDYSSSRIPAASSGLPTTPTTTSNCK